MNARIILVAIVAIFALSGCDLYGYGVVMKSTLDEAVLSEKKAAKKDLDKAVAEKNTAESELKKLKANPPKPEETLVPPSAASCKPLIDTAVANKICQAPAQVAPAKKGFIKPKTPYINKAASGGEKLPPPPEKAHSKGGENTPGGEICRLRSNGTARLLSSPTVVLAHGHVIATNLPDPASPNAQLLSKAGKEDCVTWRKWVGDKLVDRTDGSSRK